MYTKFSGDFFSRANEGLVFVADSLVGCIVELRSFTVHHEPVVANHHALLEERLLRAPIAELLAASGAHMINLRTNKLIQQNYYATLQYEIRINYSRS
jgi:hypothetical protein